MDENPVCDDGRSSLQNTAGSFFNFFRSGMLNFHIQLLQSCSLKKSCQSTLHFEHRHNLYQKYHYQERFLAGREEPSFEQVARRRTT